MVSAKTGCRHYTIHFSLLIILSSLLFLSHGQTISTTSAVVDGHQLEQQSTTITTTNAPSFLVTTEGALKVAVSSLFSPDFQGRAANVIRSEVRLVGKAVQGVKRFLSSVGSFGSLGLKVHQYDAQDVSAENSSVSSDTPSSSADEELHQSSTPIPILQDASDAIQQNKISTPFASFGSSIASSFALTLITEFGDRTFFIAAILSLKHPKLIVLFGTCLALVIQTVFSTCVGQLLHQLPANAATNTLMSFPLDDYAAALLLFVFGIIHLRAAWTPEDDESSDGASSCSEKQNHLIDNDVYVGCPGGEEEEAVEMEHQYLTPQPAEKTSDASDCSALKTPLSASLFQTNESTIANGEEIDDSNSKLESTTTLSTDDPSNNNNGSSLAVSTTTATQQRDIIPLSSITDPTGAMRRSTRLGSSLEQSHHHKNRELKEAEKATRAIELRRSNSSPPKAFEIFKETFWVIFVAELGDKSMISTVALAAAQNPYGVFFGSSFAHCVVTLVAVIAGSLLEGFISERIANGIGAVLFLTFGVMATLEGLARQGIRLWWFLGEKASALCVAYFFTMKMFGSSASSAAAASHTSSSSASAMIDGVFRMIVS